MYKYLFLLLGAILAIPVLGLIALAFILPITVWGILYLVASSLIVCGLIITPWISKHRFILPVAGLIAIILIIGIRLILTVQNTNARIKMIILPQGKGTRWIGTILDEQDGLIFGERLFHFVGGSSAKEHANITQSLYRDYSDMRQAQGVVPSPIINTYLNLQRSKAFDAVVIEPEVNRYSDIGVIFLHGYMGNVTTQCWEIAQAVSRFGSATICPSTEWRGEWWQPEGQAILKSTFDYVRSRGIQKIYLGGFSNGGFSISRLASQLKTETGLTGLFLIDGIDNRAALRETGLPILIVQGTQDERVPATYIRQIVEEIGDLGTYVEIDSDHFLIMKQPEQVQNAIQVWLEAQQSGK